MCSDTRFLLRVAVSLHLVTLHLVHPSTLYGQDKEATANLLKEIHHVRDMQRTMHQLSNVLNDGRGDQASVTGVQGPAGQSVHTDPDDGELRKKSSPAAFVGFGRSSMMPLHRFIRIGRMYGGSDYADDDGTSGISNTEKRKNSFVRIGKRPSNFVRIGKSAGRYGPVTDDDYDMGEKRGSSFVRIGKALGQSQDRIDIGDDPDERNTFDDRFLRFAKSPSSKFVRIGKIPSNFVRIGKSDEMRDLAELEYPRKRQNSFVRIGKTMEPKGISLNDRMYMDLREMAGANFEPDRFLKRASSFVRIGKNSLLPGQDKRASSFVRIGKSPIDEGLDVQHSEELGLQKRQSKFLRIGKSDFTEELKNRGNVADGEKRASNFVRIGKGIPVTSQKVGQSLPPSSSSSSSSSLSSSSPSSLPSTIHGSDSVSTSSHEVIPAGQAFDEYKPISVANRGSAFVRIGKIPTSAFVRIGKNMDVLVEPGARVALRRGSAGGQSSFVRIGK